MRINFRKLTKHRIALFLFWYMALFPGRLGYDYALLAQMVQKGESTAWWGANFYWMFRFFTFDGRSLFLLSLIGLTTLTFALYFFIWSLPIGQEYRRRTLTAIMVTPIYGFFGVTVSHDVFQTSGILLISALLLRWRFGRLSSFHQYIPVMIFSIFCLLTTHTGIVIVLFLLFFVFFNNERKVALLLLVFTTSIYLVSGLGINEPSEFSEFRGKVPDAKNALTVLILVDLKCIAQHPDALITAREWGVLERYSPKARWLSQTTCSNPDAMAGPLALDESTLEINKELVQTFFSIVSRSPAIPFVSHIQRSAVALPPPFFLPPANQIPWDSRIPLGSGTNVALQSGPGLLHPSIDEPSLAKELSVLAPLEVIAQTMALIINQASWFWGWGGLWLWPMYLCLILRLGIKRLSDCIVITAPTLILHLSIFVVGPSSLPRYVMATIFQGLIFTCLLVIGKKASA
jgi:hypothetical protein